MIKVLNIIHSLTVGGAARTMIATAKHSARLGPYEHSLVMLDLAHTDPRAVEFALQEGMHIPAARTRDDICREIEQADIVQVNWWQHPEMDEFLRSDLPEMRLLGWFHCACDKPPQLLTTSMVDYFDLTVGGSSYTYLCPAIQSLPVEERLRRTSYVVGGADFSRLQVLTRRPHTGFRVGYIGTVNWVKMHPRFVELHAGLQIPDYRVIVCGGDKQGDVLRKAKSLGEMQHFDVRGYVEDIAPVLSELDVYGYPLCEDTYAASELNLQEAMYAGVTPVVFPYGGLQTLVANEFTGLVVRSDREYREAIEHLYHHPLERDRMGANAKEFARQMFGADLHAPKMNSLYTKLLDQPKRRRAYPGRPLSALSGADLFLESLDGTLPCFAAAAKPSSLDELLDAEAAIARSTPLMCHGGVGPYAGRYPNDVLLRLWFGLALFANREPVEASTHILAAFQRGLPAHQWRALWYMALCAVDCGDREALLMLLPLLLQQAPDFEPGIALGELAAKGDVVMTDRSLRTPQFALRERS